MKKKDRYFEWELKRLFPFWNFRKAFDKPLIKYIGRNRGRRYWYGCLKSKSIGNSINRVYMMTKNKKVFEYKLIFS